MKREMSLDDDDMINYPKLRNENHESQDRGMLFLERYCRIDFVLVYQQLQNNDVKQKKRIAFLNSLKDEGLEIEIQDEGGKVYNFENFFYFEYDQHRKISDLENLVFIKVHASWETLCRYAEIMKIRKAIMSAGADYSFISRSFFKRFTNFGFLKIFKIDRNVLKPVPQGYTYPFSKQKDYLFDIPENPTDFFSPVERSLIVNYILKRKSYKTKNIENLLIWNDKNEIEMKNKPTKNNKIETSNSSFFENTSPLKDEYDGKSDDDDPRNLDFGIAKLISEGVFDSAYILHEPITKEFLKSKSNCKEINLRIKLYRYWASFRNIFRVQPLDHIRLYFGEMVAFYFAWLGYYTFWLFPIALLGVFVTFYNLYTSSNDVIINEIYNSKNITMCPVFCIKEKCEFWILSKGYAQFFLIRLIDNGATVFLAGVTSIWVFLFLEMWNRKQFTLACHWHVHDIEIEDEPLRPEFAALLEKKYPSKFNNLSGQKEPHISFLKSMSIKIFTFSTVIFSIVIALAVLTGITITKTIIRNMLRVQTTYVMSNLSTAAIGSLISLITIIILTAIYSRVAVWLTDLEHHRTQSQYDGSVTLKLYVLEFINNYSSMFYIAFIHPYTLVIPRRDSFSSIKPQGCLTGDCLLDLSMQMIFILVGKQIINNIVNYSVPRIVSLIKKHKFIRANFKYENKRKSTFRSSNPEEEVLNEEKKSTNNNYEIIHQTSGMSLHKVQPELIRCYKDNILADPEPRSLFKEYLEMIIQFGFITIFILPFPLGPLLALINNLLEIRNDAMRFVTAFRRPVAQRVKDIGIWNDILKIISKIVVKSNALLIAFATSYIDRMIYAFDHNFTLNGFVEYSLSYLNSTEAIPNRMPNTNETFCGYIGFRYHPLNKHNEPLTYTPDYWKILAAKIAFVYLFETFVGLFVKVITVIIPDVPDEFRIAMKREAAITNDFILKIELEKQRKQYDPKNMALSLKHTIVKYRNEINKQNSKQKASLIMEILKMTPKDRKSTDEKL